MSDLNLDGSSQEFDSAPSTSNAGTGNQTTKPEKLNRNLNLDGAMGSDDSDSDFEPCSSTAVTNKSVSISFTIIP